MRGRRTRRVETIIYRNLAVCRRKALLFTRRPFSFRGKENVPCDHTPRTSLVTDQSGGRKCGTAVGAVGPERPLLDSTHGRLSVRQRLPVRPCPRRQAAASLERDQCGVGRGETELESLMHDERRWRGETERKLAQDCVLCVTLCDSRRAFEIWRWLTGRPTTTTHRWCDWRAASGVARLPSASAAMPPRLCDWTVSHNEPNILPGTAPCAPIALASGEPRPV